MKMFALRTAPVSANKRLRLLRHQLPLCRSAVFLVAALLVLIGIGRVSEVDAYQQERQAPMHLIPSLKGPDLFRSYCAACHGKDGHGGGPTAAVLKSQVPDLTWRPTSPPIM